MSVVSWSWGTRKRLTFQGTGRSAVNHWLVTKSWPGWWAPWEKAIALGSLMAFHHPDQRLVHNAVFHRTRGRSPPGSLNPFTPKSDQCQISPAASPWEILHHTVWITWLFIAYSDERWLNYRFSLPHSYVFSLEGWENVILWPKLCGALL